MKHFKFFLKGEYTNTNSTKMKESDEAKVESNENKPIKETSLTENNLLNREPKRYKVKSKTELITLEKEEENEPEKIETKKQIITTSNNKPLSDNDVENNVNSSSGLGVGMSIQER